MMTDGLTQHDDPADGQAAGDLDGKAKPLDPTFVAKTGKTYALAFDIDAVRAAKRELGIRITDIWTGNLVYRLRTEPDLAVDLAHLASSVDDPVTFARLVGVEKLNAMTNAVIDAAADFSCALTNDRTPEKVARARNETFENMIALADARAKVIPIDQLDELAKNAISSLSGLATDSPASPA
jgi:hypothetical protein